MPAHLSSRTLRIVKIACGIEPSRAGFCGSMGRARATFAARRLSAARRRASARPRHRPDAASRPRQPPLRIRRRSHEHHGDGDRSRGTSHHRTVARGVRGLRGRRPPGRHAVHARAGADRSGRAARHQRQHVRQAHPGRAGGGRSVSVRPARSGRRVLPARVQSSSARADRMDARTAGRAAGARRAAAVGRHGHLRRDRRGAAGDRPAFPASAPRCW